MTKCPEFSRFSPSKTLWRKWFPDVGMQEREVIIFCLDMFGTQEYLLHLLSLLFKLLW